MKWSFIQNNGLMSKIKQPNKNWINDHNFNKDLTFKIMEKKKYRKTNVPFNCQQPWLLGSSIPCRDSSSSLRRHILPRRVVLVQSSSRWVVVVESSSHSYGASSSHPRRASFHEQIIGHIWLHLPATRFYRRDSVMQQKHLEFTFSIKAPPFPSRTSIFTHKHIF